MRSGLQAVKGYLAVWGFCLPPRLRPRTHHFCHGVLGGLGNLVDEAAGYGLSVLPQQRGDCFQKRTALVQRRGGPLLLRRVRSLVRRVNLSLGAGCRGAAQRQGTQAVRAGWTGGAERRVPALTRRIRTLHAVRGAAL